MAAAPALVTWSSASARVVARSAWAMVASGSPWTSDSAERYSSTAAGSRSHSDRSMMIVPGGGSPSRRRRRGEMLREVVEAIFGRRELSAGHQRTDEAQGQHWSRLHHRVGDDGEPGGDGCLLPVPLQRRHRQLDEVRRPVDVSGSERMPHGRDSFSRLVVPPTGAAVQVCDLLVPLVEEVGPHDLREQVVVAVPVPGAVEGYEEQVGPVQVLEHLLTAHVARHGVAQRAAQPVEDGGPEQEVAHLGRLPARAPLRPGSPRCSGRRRRRQR